MSTKLDPATKLLFSLTGFMAFVMGIIVYTVVLSDDPWSGRKAPNPRADATDAKPGVISCDATSLDGPPCPANHFCRFDRCEPFVPETNCKEGESCRDCLCEEGLVCHLNRCMDRTKVPRTPLICRKNKRLNDAVKTLADKCASRNKSPDAIVTTGTCSPADWEALAIEDDKFDLLLSAFPNRFAVHFPSGRPFLDGTRKTWPTGEISAYYLDQIRAHAQSLREAKQIFVIGRASPDGSAEDNRMYALKRMTMVTGMLDIVLYEGLTETQRDERRVRIRSFALPTKLPDGREGAKPIDPSRYKEVYLTDPPGSEPSGLDPIVSWDSVSHQTITRFLEDPAVLTKRDGLDWNYLFNAVNRVVLVIPIPCLGDEFKPGIDDLENVEAL